MTTEPMPAESVAQLLAKGAKLDSWTRTIANGVRGAKRANADRYIGATATSYYITETMPIQGLRFIAHADGTVDRVVSSYEDGVA